MPERKESLHPVSVAIILLHQEGNQICTVLGKRRDGKISPVGGGVKGGEHIFDALRREWREETGTRLEDMVVVGGAPIAISSSGPNPSFGALYAGEFIGRTLPRPPKGSELTELISFTPTQLRSFMEQRVEFLYRPDFNFENLRVLLGLLLPTNELIYHLLFTLARAHTRETIRNNLCGHPYHKGPDLRYEGY